MKNRELNTLIKRLKNKDNQAFEKLYNELWRIVYYIAYQHVNDKESAKDITQEAFIIVYQKIDELKDIEAFNRWMNRIVFNLCNRHLNLSNKHNFVDIENIFEDELTEENVEFLPAELLHDKNKRDQLLKEITNLPLDMKDIVLLYYFEEMTIMAIADVLHMSKSLVHKRLGLAKNILKTKFESNYETRKSTIPSLAIITIVLKENSNLICTESIEKTIYSGIKSKLNINISTKFISKLIFQTLFVVVAGIFVYGGYEIFASNTPTNAQIEKERKITLATFVGNEYASLIESWKVRSDVNNHETILKIEDEYGLKNEYYIYLEQDEREVYILYTKKIDNNMLLLAERYDSNNLIWSVTYQIINNDTKVIAESELKQWFLQNEEKRNN